MTVVDCRRLSTSALKMSEVVHNSKINQSIVSHCDKYLFIKYKHVKNIPVKCVNLAPIFVKNDLVKFDVRK